MMTRLRPDVLLGIDESDIAKSTINLSWPQSTYKDIFATYVLSKQYFHDFLGISVNKTAKTARRAAFEEKSDKVLMISFHLRLGLGRFYLRQ